MPQLRGARRKRGCYFVSVLMKRLAMPAVFSTSRKPELEVAGAVLVRRFGGTWSGDSGMCRCPAHADKTPSLSVRIGETRLLFKCFAGCDISDVLRALRRDGLNALDARDGRGAPSSDRKSTRLPSRH